MAQSDSIDLNCPLCRGKFSTPAGTVGSSVACPHCGGQVKVPGSSVTRNDDDDDWLRLDDEPFEITAALPDDSPSAQPEPDIFANPSTTPLDDSSLDEFILPDLPPTAPLPGTHSVGMPPLSEADLNALSGFSDDDEQDAAPVKTTRVPAASDSFRVRCPICESITYAKVHQVGKQIRCGDCHSTITVPPPPKVKPKYEPDIAAAKAFTFQGGDDEGVYSRPADPFQKSADEYLRDAAASVESAPADDWSVPSISEWLLGVVGIFRDPGVIVYWLILTTLAAVPAGIAVQFTSPIAMLGLYAGGILFAGVLIAHGFAILQSVANGEKRVSEWPAVDFWEWMGPLFVAVSAVVVAAGPILAISQFFWGNSLMTVALAMMSLYLLYPFVLLSMLDEQSVFVPFSADISKSVTRSSEHWGLLYLSSGILFFGLFLFFMATSVMSPVSRIVLSIAASVAAAFIYFGLLGRLAFSIGQSINGPPMENDIVRDPKLPQ